MQRRSGRKLATAGGFAYMLMGDSNESIMEEWLGAAGYSSVFGLRSTGQFSWRAIGLALAGQPYPGRDLRRRLHAL